MSIAIITRCKDEPYLHEFLNYYFHEGIDHIYIIEDLLCSPKQFKTVLPDPRITIIRGLKYSNGKELTKVFKKYRNKHKWIISCDIDEFICTKRNPTRTIKEEIEATFENASCIYVPWVMMAYNQQKRNPDCLLETNVYRWNHDKKHKVKQSFPSNIRPYLKGFYLGKFQCLYKSTPHKPIFRAKHFKTLGAHAPHKHRIDKPKKISSLEDPKNRQVREQSIATAYFVCYHFRIVSKQHIRMKMKNTSIRGYDKPISSLIMSKYDFPEIVDTTLKEKSQSRPKLFKPVKLK